MTYFKKFVSEEVDKKNKIEINIIEEIY